MAQSETIIIATGFSGPRGSGNGGYVSGRLASFVPGNSAEVTLRARTPIEKPLQVHRMADGSARLQDGDALICEARPGRPAVTPPAPPFDWAMARRLREHGGSDAATEFGGCIVCGRGRGCGDGLQVWSDRVPGVPGLSLGLYTPHANHADAEGRIRPEFVWGTLDCPGAWAARDADATETALTGRLTAQIIEPPKVGEACIVVGWRVRTDGRKLYSGTALYTEGGRLCAFAEQLWVVLRS